MKITHESPQPLTAEVKIELTFKDYEEGFNTALNEIRKTAQIKGFRPGKVPVGLVRKMYGPKVAADEVNKMLSESLTQYISDQKFNMIGQPLANVEKTKEMDLLSDDLKEFYFDIGLSPEFELPFDENQKFEYFKITSDDERMDQHIEDLKKRYGNNVEADEVGDGDLITGTITELDLDGNYLEDGISHETTISVDYIKDEESKKAFLKKKPGDVIKFNPLNATGNKAETAAMLNVKKEDLGEKTNDFELVIDKISRLEPARLNKDFYSSVFPDDKIANKEEFKARIWQDAASHYQVEADGYFSHLVMDYLLKNTTIDLPDNFIKRWMLSQDENLKEATLEENYNHYANSFRHELLVNKLVDDLGIKIGEKELRDHITEQYAKMFGGAENEAMKEQLKMIVDNVMQNKEEVIKIYNQLLTGELVTVFKEKFQLDEKELSYQEFAEIVKNHQHDHDHE